MNLGPERANGPVGCSHGYASPIAPSEHRPTARRCTVTGRYSLPGSPIYIQIHIYTTSTGLVFGLPPGGRVRLLSHGDPEEVKLPRAT